MLNEYMLESLAVIVLWAVNVLVDSAGQLAFKAAANVPHPYEGALDRWRRMAMRPWIWLGVGCFAIEFVVWLAFLSVVPLAAGVMLGMLSIVLVMVGGRLCFGEPLSRPRIVGAGLIVIGVSLVALS